MREDAGIRSPGATVARAARLCEADFRSEEAINIAASRFALTQARHALEDALAAVVLALPSHEAPPLTLKREKRDPRAQAIACLNSMHQRSKLTQPALGEGAWAILLDLFVNADRNVSISSACVGSGHPATTALRWIKLLEEAGLIVRQPDKADGRRVFVELTDLGRAMVLAYLRC